MKIIEELITEVKYDCDVAVCGGGIAGIAAALSAARAGKRVILTERQFMLGGLATAGLVTIYLPLCDGYGNQVSFGIAEELLRLSVEGWHDDKRGYCNWIESPIKNDESTARFEVNFNPWHFAISAEQLLLRENVKILYGTTAVSASASNGKIEAVVFENKSGRFGISAQSFVDATGDADLAVFANAPFENFKQGNVLAAWYYSDNDGGYERKQHGFADIPDSQKARQKERVELISDKRYTGLDGEEISDMMCATHVSILNDIEKRREVNDNLQITTMPIIPQLRMTRRVIGECTVDISDDRKYFKDSIGLVSNWRKRGPVYEVPFGTLYNKTVKNLLFAGRITSVTDEMWDIMRVIPCCAVTGEAAGLAASMTDDMTQLDIALLQAELEKRGVKLHCDK